MVSGTLIFWATLFIRTVVIRYDLIHKHAVSAPDSISQILYATFCFSKINTIVSSTLELFASSYVFFLYLNLFRYISWLL